MSFRWTDRSHAKGMLAGVLVLILAATAGGAVALTAPVAQAVTVTVNPGTYVGEYDLNGWHTGTQAVGLEPGKYFVTVGEQAGFDIDVAADGTVGVATDSPILVPDSAACAATGGAGTLSFNNVLVPVDPSSYLNRWTLARAMDGWASGPRSLELPCGLRYRVAVGSYGAAGLCVWAVSGPGVGVHGVR